VLDSFEISLTFFETHADYELYNAQTSDIPSNKIVGITTKVKD